MKFLKNIAVIICLTTIQAALGMNEKFQKIVDLRYTDAKMLQAIKENNIPRVTYLLQRAELHKKILKKSPISPGIIVEAIRSHNKEMITLLLGHNVPLDGKAVNAALDWRYDEPVEHKDIKQLVELLLQHKAPLDSDALENGFYCRSLDIFELLLQHNAPLSETTFGLITSFGKLENEKEIELCVKYKPTTYTHIIEAARKRDTLHKPIFKTIFWYVDNTALKDVMHNDLPVVEGSNYSDQRMWDYIWWFRHNNDLENLSRCNGVDMSFYFALLMLQMPNLTPAKDFSKLLDRIEELDPNGIQALLTDLHKTGRDINKKAFETVVDFVICKNNEAVIQECYLLYKDNDALRPIISNKFSAYLRKQRMDDKFMHHALYANVRFLFQ